MRIMNVISSHNYKHEILTETVNKVALSDQDDKRIICEDGINTYPYGHYKTLSGGNWECSGTTWSCSLTNPLFGTCSK